MMGKKSNSGVVVNRNSWTHTTLGKVYDVRDGTHDSPKYQNDGYPLVTSKNLKENCLDLNNIQYISEADYLKINERSLVNQGDVLFAMIGTIGNPVVIIEKPNFAIKNVALFKVPEDQNSFFLKYYLQSNYVKEKMQAEAKGTTQKFVGLGYLRGFPIILPPLAEQKRIVAILDEAFAGISQAIANTEKNLANARELFDSYLESASHDKKPLGNFVNIKTGKLDANAAVIGGIYPFFTCSREVYQIDNFAFDCEAVLLAGNNASGDFNVKHFSGKFNAYQRTYVITIKNEKDLLYRFLYYQLIKSLKELKNKSVGAGTKFLKLGMIQNLEIDIPPITLQQTILDKLENLSSETESLIAIYQQKLQSLAELKQSLLQKAFSGELTANNIDKLVDV